MPTFRSQPGKAIIVPAYAVFLPPFSYLPQTFFARLAMMLVRVVIYSLSSLTLSSILPVAAATLSWPFAAAVLSWPCFFLPAFFGH